MTASTITCGLTGGARKSINGEAGNLIFSNSEVRMKAGNSIVVLTLGVLYLRFSCSVAESPHRLSNSKRRVECKLTRAALLAQ